MLSTTVSVGDDGGVLARPEVSTSGLLRRRRSVDRRQDPSVGLDVDHRRVASTADVLKMPQKLSMCGTRERRAVVVTLDFKAAQVVKHWTIDIHDTGSNPN